MARERSCPLRSKLYGGISTGGGYQAYTEYEIGAQRIAEAAHCILGSLGKNLGRGQTDWEGMLRTEAGHILEELDLITGVCKEYSRSIYTRQFHDISDYKVEYQERAVETATKSVDSILAASPKLRARAEEMLALVARDETIPTEIRLVAVGTYMVLIELANAMEISVADWSWPDRVHNAFRNPELITSIETLRERIATLYPGEF